MSRLVCFDLRQGRVIAIQGVRHCIKHVPSGGAMLTLKPESGDGEAIQMSRSELGTLLVIEEAEFVDELEDPEAISVREVTNLSYLPPHRIIDWHGKVFMLRQLMAMAGSSPKSPVFQQAFESAGVALKDWRAGFGLGDAKTWSRWTIYHDLQRWRSQRYSLAAIQRKGVEYSPWERRSELYEVAREVAQEIALKNPHYSVARVHEATNQHLHRHMANKKELGHE